MDALDELERRVGEKWARAVADRMNPQWQILDTSSWMLPLPPDGDATKDPLLPQFPREQWASYPNKRMVALLACDRMLDFDDLSDEQWMTLCLLMQYGGKTRIS